MLWLLLLFSLFLFPCVSTFILSDEHVLFFFPLSPLRLFLPSALFLGCQVPLFAFHFGCSSERRNLATLFVDSLLLSPGFYVNLCFVNLCVCVCVCVCVRACVSLLLHSSRGHGKETVGGAHASPSSFPSHQCITRRGENTLLCLLSSSPGGLSPATGQ